MVSPPTHNHPPRPGVLVVDDEPASVDLLRISLGERYAVHTATSGAAALTILEAHPDIAVAVIDQRMPEMSGTELIRRTIAPYPHLVRIILTGYTDTESLIDAINAGSIFRYLTKPWAVPDLVSTVAQGVEIHRLNIDNIRLTEELREANARLTVENR
jgi:response regulator RpfG family c-di-GMP phosphodiesterase